MRGAFGTESPLASKLLVLPERVLICSVDDLENLRCGQAIGDEAIAQMIVTNRRWAIVTEQREFADDANESADEKGPSLARCSSFSIRFRRGRIGRPSIARRQREGAEDRRGDEIAAAEGPSAQTESVSADSRGE